MKVFKKILLALLALFLLSLGVFLGISYGKRSQRQESKKSEESYNASAYKEVSIKESYPK